MNFYEWLQQRQPDNTAKDQVAEKLLSMAPEDTDGSLGDHRWWKVLMSVEHGALFLDYLADKYRKQDVNSTNGSNSTAG